MFRGEQSNLNLWFSGNRRKRKEIGGMGRAEPAPYPQYLFIHHGNSQRALICGSVYLGFDSFFKGKISDKPTILDP